MPIHGLRAITHTLCLLFCTVRRRISHSTSVTLMKWRSFAQDDKFLFTYSTVGANCVRPHISSLFRGGPLLPPFDVRTPRVPETAKTDEASCLIRFSSYSFATKSLNISVFANSTAPLSTSAAVFGSIGSRASTGTSSSFATSSSLLSPNTEWHLPQSGHAK